MEQGRGDGWPAELRPLDVAALRESFAHAKPFPHFVVEPFLEPAFAHEVAAAFPTMDRARSLGREFRAVNENLKVQVTDPTLFAEPVGRLSDALAAPAFCAALSQVTGIPNLLADEKLAGGGMHLMASGGRLDVHVDFNLLRDRGLYRRLNILVFLNEGWHEDWGGRTELWDPTVRHCGASLAPLLNRCLVFETSEISFHGVTPVRCPKDRARQSFAGYYYTREAPSQWAGQFHDTIFKARPNERLRAAVLVPLESALRSVRPALRRVKRAVLGRGPGAGTDPPGTRG
jgi:Rps23 Pro-64 3,4-dihydroxylase Tpa1-like proline 4-hydroxylase